MFCGGTAVAVVCSGRAQRKAVLFATQVAWLVALRTHVGDELFGNFGEDSAGQLSLRVHDRCQIDKIIEGHELKWKFAF